MSEPLPNPNQPPANNDPKFAFINNAYKLLFNNTSDAILITDDEGNYIEVNEAATKIFGYSRNEFLKLRVSDIVLDWVGNPAILPPSSEKPEDSSTLEKTWRDFQSQGIQKGSVKCRTKNNQIIELEYTAVASFLPDISISMLKEVNVAEKVLANIRRRDINKRVLNQNEKSIVQARFEAILRAMPDVMLAVTSEGVISDCYIPNDMDSFFDEQPRQGMLLSEVLPDDPPESMHLSYMEDSLKSMQVVVYESQLRLKNESRFIEIRICPINDQELLYLLRDNTQKQQHEQQLKETREKLDVILNYSAQPLLIIDSGLLIQGFDKLAASLVRNVFGKKLSEGMPVMEIVLPRDIEDFNINYNKALNGETVYSEKSFFDKVRNKTLWMRFSYHLVPEGINKPSVMLNITDITDLKEIKQIIQKNNDLSNDGSNAI